MLNVIKLLNDNYMILHDTYTDSANYILTSRLESLLNRGLEVNNVELIDIGFEFKWEFTNKSIIVLATAPHDTFKVVGQLGNVSYMTKDKLIEAIKCKRVANAIIDNEEIITSNTYEISEDIEFEEKIQKEYGGFIAKCKLIGKDMSFDYLIENGIVKLKKYTGTEKEVALPRFVGAVMSKAFNASEVHSLRLNSQLKYIGADIFNSEKLRNPIYIPESVEFIGINRELTFVSDKVNSGLVCIGDNIYSTDGTSRVYEGL